MGNCASAAVLAAVDGDDAPTVNKVATAVSAPGRSAQAAQQPADGAPGGHDVVPQRSQLEVLASQPQILEEDGWVAQASDVASWPRWLVALAREVAGPEQPLRSIEAYERVAKIGQGTYSSVYKGVDRGTGEPVALKKVQFDPCDRSSMDFMSREVRILAKLRHPNVVKLLAVAASRKPDSLYLVFEYLPHDLQGLVTSRSVGSLSEAQAKRYLQQLLHGLEYCHSHGVYHRDIKASNLLVGNNGELKIADFGLATHAPSNWGPLTTRVVTLWYRPPELLLGQTNYDASIDLWSVGCLLAELVVGRPMLPGRTEVEQLHRIYKLCGTPPDEYWDRLQGGQALVMRPPTTYPDRLAQVLREKGLEEPTIDLVQQLMSYDPSRRGTAAGLLRHQYFSAGSQIATPSEMPNAQDTHRAIPIRQPPAPQRRPSGRSFTGTAAGQHRSGSAAARPPLPRVQTIGPDTRSRRLSRDEAPPRGRAGPTKPSPRAVAPSKISSHRRVPSSETSGLWASRPVAGRPRQPRNSRMASPPTMNPRRDAVWSAGNKPSGNLASVPHGLSRQRSNSRESNGSSSSRGSPRSTGKVLYGNGNSLNVHRTSYD